MDVGGGGGKWTRFKVRPTSANSVKFESCELPGKFVAVRQNAVAVGGGTYTSECLLAILRLMSGGKFTKFSVWSNSEDGDGGDYEAPQEAQEVQPQVVYYQQPAEEPAPEATEEGVAEPEPEPEAEYVAPPEPEVEPEAEPEPEPEAEAEPEEKEYVSPEFDEADVHEQPLKDPRPSIEAAAHFDE